jgi:heme-degrading monooxygenase HmoA
VVTLYSSNEWIVRAGNEDEFLRTWAEFSRWGRGLAPGSGHTRLLRDGNNPRRFVSFGDWDSESLAMVRSQPEYGAFNRRLEELVESVTRSTLDLMVEE